MCSMNFQAYFYYSRSALSDANVMEATNNFKFSSGHFFFFFFREMERGRGNGQE